MCLLRRMLGRRRGGAWAGLEEERGLRSVGTEVWGVGEKGVLGGVDGLAGYGLCQL